eukprot:GHVT01010674.1.p2 GENE.GHVT01010674.1~~GHVT01010674.1.p2  ORF type:complete len:102 (-),score=17.90 GHVT01010674.1:412-717(-)
MLAASSSGWCMRLGLCLPAWHLLVFSVGTRGSRFSQAVRWERLLNGMSWSSSGRQFCVAGDPQGWPCFAVKEHSPEEGADKQAIAERIRFLHATAGDPSAN